MGVPASLSSRGIVADMTTCSGLAFRTAVFSLALAAVLLVPAVGPVMAEEAQAEADAPPEAPAAASPIPALKPPTPTPQDVIDKGQAECTWTGKRVVSLLSRDDVDTARRFLDFYTLFGCEQATIGKALRCVVRDGDEAAVNESAAARLDRCWGNAAR